jgi:plasmid stabilization system protein ParE
MAEIIWSPRAIKDIHEIAEFISKSSIQYAEEQVRSFFAAATLPENYPFRGRIVPGYHHCSSSGALAPEQSGDQEIQEEVI